jgi:type II secretory ATPase GspE/PulE/Tfp pilus assembly ATPase PilB-like protein
MFSSKSDVTLPWVTLKGMQVPFEVLSLIPEETSAKYQVVVFEADEKTMKLAVAHPEQLKQGFYIALKDLGKKIGKEVKLYQTDPASIRYIGQQYKENKQGEGEEVKQVIGQKEEAPIPDPPLFELGKTVAFNYLKRVPVSFAQNNRIVCVDFLPPNIYWFITDKGHKDAAGPVLKFIEQRNNIKGYLLEVEKRDVDDLLKYYAETTKQHATQSVSDEKMEEDNSFFEDSEAESKSAAAASGVLVPDTQATILTAEEQKEGIAGLIQKMGQSMPATDHNEEEVPDEEPIPTPAVVSPVTTFAAPPTSGVPTIPPTRPKTTSTDVDSEIGHLLSKSVDTLDELKMHLQEGFIPRIVAAVVSFAIHEKASDVHLESFEDEVRIRYRVDGQLIDVVKLPSDIHAAMVSRIKILSRLRLDETRIPQDGRFDVNFNDKQVDLRVSVMPTVHGEKVVMRILDKSKGISSLESLGIEGLAYENLTKAINKPYGVCLATGPTGSGKSTSLYAILNRIATPNVNVVTLEDPVEYEMKGINQSQVRPKIGFTFAEGLRSVLRQDPNIIMVGEIRDGETATMCTQAALTGHLVLSTLHTNDASGAIPRLTNMGIEPFLITSSLNVAMGQRLVRKICQKCKSEVSLPQGVRDQISKEIEGIRDINPLDAKRVPEKFTFYQGKGCDACRGSGYEGRIGIYEVLTMTDGIEEKALDRVSGGTIQAQAVKDGMITMYQDGLLKVVSGITTLDEVLRETSNK